MCVCVCERERGVMDSLLPLRNPQLNHFQSAFFEPFLVTEKKESSKPKSK